MLVTAHSCEDEDGNPVAHPHDGDPPPSYRYINGMPLIVPVPGAT